MRYFAIGVTLLVLGGCATGPDIDKRAVSKPDATYRELFLLGVL